MKKIVSSLLLLLTLILLTYASFADEGIKENPNITIVIDGKTGSYSAVPIEVNGRTLLPLREVLVNLGVQNDDNHIIWNNSEKSVNIVKDDVRIYLRIGSDKAKVNGRDIPLSAEPVMYKDRTYIPARFVAESLGKKVVWDDELKKVLITDDANLKSISSILNDAGSKMKSINKYKITQTLKTEFKTFLLSDSVTVKAEHKIDQKNRLVSGSANISTRKGSSSEDISYEIFGDGYRLYTKENANSAWEETELSDQQLEDENRKIFDAYYFLKPSDVLCAAIVEEESPKSDEIILKGSTFPHEMMKMLLRNSSVLEKEFFRNGELEIVVDKPTGVFKSINIKFHNSSGFTQANLDCTWENTEINGSFQVAIPKELTALTTASNEVADGEKQMDMGNYEEAVRHFDKAIQADPKSSIAISNKSIALYYMGRFNESIQYIDKYIALIPDDSDSFVWKAKNYIQLRQYDKALEDCNNAIDLNESSSFAYNVKALAYKYKRNYKDALDSVNKAIEYDDNYADAYVNKVSILYYYKRFDECIDFADKARALAPKNEDIPWFKADCYSALAQHDKAIQAYQDALTINPENDIVVSNIGWEYYYLQNYSKAEEYLQKALKLNGENEGALELKEYLAEAKLPEGQKIINFIKSNYLYFDKVSSFEEKSKELLTKNNVTAKDAANYIDGIKLTEDAFTFVISGKEYDDYVKLEENNDVLCKELSKNSHYIRISTFTSGVSNEVRSYLDTIGNTEASNLIIDLRDNGGGLTKASNEILDYLLPECTTSFMISREGQIYPYYSDENQVKFKKIIVLVNEYSASSSELLTLGLKKYLNNVVVIGKPTFGKGVGQFVYEDKNDKYMVFLVSFYWNVKEQNIMGSRITPDITVNGTSDVDYFNEINKIK